jgi:hypothetical protein
MDLTSSPSLIVWTEHAAAKAALLGIPVADVESVVLEHHAARRANHRAGDWMVTTDRLAVVYNHPDVHDETAARVVTLWRRR